MSLSPLAYADSLRVGTIDFVSPDEIRAQLDIEAPDQVALNTGEPRVFPRVNGYVLIPCDGGYLVAQVVWITIERSQYPKRQGLKDFGLIDLPYPLRKMSLTPMGVLSLNDEITRSTTSYEFHRGVEGYPTVGDPVLIPTQAQLRAIIESGKNRYVLIGHSPLAANAEVRVDPNRLFSRHLAVLGNTGSGKSCSVAGLIRWSLEEAKEQREDAGSNNRSPNARFIILDPNGEYSNTFCDIDGTQIFAVEGNDACKQLKVPFWLWNTEEWATFAKASSKTQRPVLAQALRSARDGVFDMSVLPSADMRRYLRSLLSAIQEDIGSGRPWKSPGTIKGFRDKLQVWRKGLECNNQFTDLETQIISQLDSYIDDTLLNSHAGEWPQAFNRNEIKKLEKSLSKAYSIFGGKDKDGLPLSADLPRFFAADSLLRGIEANALMMNVSEHVETMAMRVRAMLADDKIKQVSEAGDSFTLDQWLNTYIGDDGDKRGPVTVIDLSLIPAEVIQIVTAVIARMTLEALQRYRKLNDGKVLPTVLVMEEAHTFIKRYSQDSDDQSASRLCTEIFEKIAREGRKFGLGLVLSSQRPSELSPTVLSQCNSFLLHRISNDKDQELVHRLVPDNMHGLMKDLPVLPARQAILMGWASELPVLVEMNKLPENQQPKSSDPDFWEVWTGEESRSVNWKAVADDWQQVNSSVEGDDSGHA